MNYEQMLQKLGYSNHEAKIYLAALELGEATISELAHKAEIPRTTVQEAVEHMHRKGLLLSYLKKTHKYWVAEEPEKILSNLKANEALLAGFIPELANIRNRKVSKPSVKFYSGISELKSIMEDILETKHHICALISMDDWFQFFGIDYTQDFINRRRSRFLKIRMICPRSEMAVKLKKSDEQELRHIKFLPKSMELHRITNFIYGNKIAILSFNKKEPTGIVIEDQDIAYGNMLYFENLWEHSTES